MFLFGLLHSNGCFLRKGVLSIFNCGQKFITVKFPGNV